MPNIPQVTESHDGNDPGDGKLEGGGPPAPPGMPVPAGGTGNPPEGKPKPPEGFAPLGVMAGYVVDVKAVGPATGMVSFAEIEGNPLLGDALTVELLVDESTSELVVETSVSEVVESTLVVSGLVSLTLDVVLAGTVVFEPDGGPPDGGLPDGGPPGMVEL